jgi:hypothetical protein
LLPDLRRGFPAYDPALSCFHHVTSRPDQRIAYQMMYDDYKTGQELVKLNKILQLLQIGCVLVGELSGD